MTSTLTFERPTNPVAQLGGSHGYRLEGDVAHLNAEILCDESRLTGQNWALQLWTDEGVKISELFLGLLQPNGTGCLYVGGSATALPPAGEGPFIVSMTLVSGIDGLLDTIEDCASYVQPVSFVQPRLQGTVCSGFSNDGVTFDIARIANPRDVDNISGTLSLELWATDEPYKGGAWTGTPVASLVLGTLAGQTEWTDCHYTTHAGPLPAEGHLTLMLREWTPAGYVTRDYRTLARPTAAAVQVEETKPAKKGKTKDASAVKEPKAAKGETKAEAKAEVKAEVKAEAKPVADKEAKVVAKAVTEKAKGVSVNTASAAELTAIKGISNAVAKAIIAARPYVSLDELTRAKGVGAKLLDKVRGSFKL